MNFNPVLDLKLQRIVDVAPELVWTAWTQPEHLMPWFCPRPWKTIDCEIDLRPGGIFRTTMQSPEGQQFPNTGCYLEVVPNRRLSWTNVLEPGFRPKIIKSTTNADSEGCPEFAFTAIIELEPHGNGGTKYTAYALHADESSAKLHRDMGFEQGWGTCLDQLVKYVKTVW